MLPGPMVRIHLPPGESRVRTSRRLFWGEVLPGSSHPAPAGITEILPGRCDSRSTQDRFFCILDEKRVNVLKFNLALDQLH